MQLTNLVSNGTCLMRTEYCLTLQCQTLPVVNVPRNAENDERRQLPAATYGISYLVVI
jgi:hypothetical protein